MQKNKLNRKNKMKIMDDENFPVQCHPIIISEKKKSEKKKSEEEKIETV
jgi:hypothetical protein